MDADAPISAKKPARKPPPDPREQCRQRAARLLSVRSHAVAELRRKLQRGFPGDIVDTILAEFAGLGFLDDRKFAAAYAEWRGASRGAARLRQELARRGVPRDIVDETLAARRQEADPEAEAQAVLEMAQRKWNSIRDRSDRLKAKAKVARFLAARGFASDAIYQALSQLKK